MFKYGLGGFRQSTDDPPGLRVDFAKSISNSKYNKYAYVDGNPLSSIDPEGLQAQGASALCGPYFWVCAGVITAGTAMSTPAGRDAIKSAVTKVADACKAGDPCEELQRQIRDIAAKLETKLRQKMADRWNLYENAYSQNPGGAIAGKGTWIGHDAKITWLKTGLARKVMEAKVLGCQVSPEVLQLIASPNPQMLVR